MQRNKLTIIAWVIAVAVVVLLGYLSANAILGFAKMKALGQTPAEAIVAEDFPEELEILDDTGDVLDDFTNYGPTGRGAELIAELQKDNPFPDVAALSGITLREAADSEVVAQYISDSGAAVDLKLTLTVKELLGESGHSASPGLQGALSEEVPPGGFIDYYIGTEGGVFDLVSSVKNMTEETKSLGDSYVVEYFLSHYDKSNIGGLPLGFDFDTTTMEQVLKSCGMPNYISDEGTHVTYELPDGKGWLVEYAFGFSEDGSADYVAIARRIDYDVLTVPVPY
jgi:hypothetical protein